MSKPAINDNEIIQQLAEDILVLRQVNVEYGQYATKMDQLLKLIQPKLMFFIYKFFSSQIDREDQAYFLPT